ncbi:MAG: FAD-dependent oxidoreductase [Candidatus Humimicrobiaceae bacterium]
MIYDLVVIGTGPAGITASIYAARKKLKLLVITRELGGQVIYNLSVENYTGFQEISGAELVQKFKNHLEEFKFEYVEEEAKSLQKEKHFITQAGNKSFGSRAVIISTGTKPKALNIKGEKEYKNKGISYCATCDAPLFSGKTVAVIGSGNHALYSAVQLLEIAKKLYVLSPQGKLKGKQVLVDKVKGDKKAEIIEGAEILEITGKQLVSGLKYKAGGKTDKIDVQGIFINIGYEPQTGFLGSLVDLNHNKEIIIDRFNNTSLKGAFAAGDCTNYPYKQIIVAAGQGASATLSAYQYLSNQ